MVRKICLKVCTDPWVTYSFITGKVEANLFQDYLSLPFAYNHQNPTWNEAFFPLELNYFGSFQSHCSIHF